MFYFQLLQANLGASIVPLKRITLETRIPMAINRKMLKARFPRGSPFGFFDTDTAHGDPRLQVPFDLTPMASYAPHQHLAVLSFMGPSTGACWKFS